MEQQVGKHDAYVIPIENLELETLKALELERVDVIVTMLSDEENLKICELAYKHYGTRTLITRLNERKNAPRFKELGVIPNSGP